MKKHIKKIITVILIFAAFMWVIDKIPFTKRIEQQIDAAVYKDGELIDITTVFMTGTKTRYLFRPDSFVGEFRIPCVEGTDVDDLQTQISWHSNDNLQSISHFYKGDFSTADKRELAYYLIISNDMKNFALMTTNQEVIATSDELCQLYTDHISYDGDGRMTVIGIEEIPSLN